MILSASILSADFLNLERDCRAAIEAGCEWLHIDVMDGQFVPNLTFGLPIVRALKPLAEEAGAVLDVHLMIDDPERQAAAYVKAGADIVTVHWEACRHHHRAIQEIREAGGRAGMALNPGTPVSVLTDVVSELDLILIMSVNPGFSGQAFIPASTQRVAEAARLAADRRSRARVAVDGGVASGNASALLRAGADVLIAASAIFGGDIADNVAALRRASKEFV